MTKKIKGQSVLTKVTENLNLKEKKFVAEFLTGNHKNRAELMYAAGLSRGIKSTAARKAYDYLNKPKVQNALAKYLDYVYPNLELDVVDFIKSVFSPESQEKEVEITCPHCNQLFKHKIQVETISVSNKLKTLQLLLDIKGWKEPKKSVGFSVNIDKYTKLPSDEE